MQHYEFDPVFKPISTEEAADSAGDFTIVAAQQGFSSSEREPGEATSLAAQVAEHTATSPAEVIHEPNTAEAGNELEIVYSATEHEIEESAVQINDGHTSAHVETEATAEETEQFEIFYTTGEDEREQSDPQIENEYTNAEVKWKRKR